MKKLTKLFLVALCLFVANPSVQAQSIKKTGQTGLQFLKLDMLARSAGMGGASIMSAQGAAATFKNPAGLAEMESSLDFFVSQTGWIADINYIAVAVAKDLGNLGMVGINFVTADYGDNIIGTRVDPSVDAGYIETGALTVNASAIGLTFARRLTNSFRFGAQIKYASQQLGESLMPKTSGIKENKVGGLAYDFGTIFYPGLKSLRIGMSVRNFSEQFQYEDEAFELPLTFRLGAAMNVFDLISGPANSSLLVEVNALHPRDYSERLHFGGEFLFADLFAIRAGYKTNYDQESFSMGFGVKYNVGGIGLRVDYSYSDLGVFEGVNRFTIAGSL